MGQINLKKKTKKKYNKRTAMRVGIIIIGRRRRRIKENGSTYASLYVLQKYKIRVSKTKQNESLISS